MTTLVAYLDDIQHRLDALARHHHVPGAVLAVSAPRLPVRRTGRPPVQPAREAKATTTREAKAIAARELTTARETPAA